MEDWMNELLGQYADDPAGNRQLSDAIAKKRAATINPAAVVPVTKSELPPPKRGATPMRGDGTAAVNKGVVPKGQPDKSPAGSMDSYLDDKINAQSDFGGVAPGKKPYAAKTPMSAVNNYQNGPGPSFGARVDNTVQNVKGMMPNKVPAPTAESLAAQRGSGNTPDALWQAIVHRLSNPRF